MPGIKLITRQQKHPVTLYMSGSSLSKLCASHQTVKVSSWDALGAHSLGRCRLVNSGFEGAWDLTELAMDKGYYQAMKMSSMVPTKFDNDKVRLVIHWLSLCYLRRAFRSHLSTRVLIVACSEPRDRNLFNMIVIDHSLYP